MNGDASEEVVVVWCGVHDWMSDDWVSHQRRLRSNSNRLGRYACAWHGMALKCMIVDGRLNLRDRMLLSAEYASETTLVPKECLSGTNIIFKCATGTTLHAHHAHL